MCQRLVQACWPLTTVRLTVRRQPHLNLPPALFASLPACSVWLDTFGREVVVRRPVEHEPSGWPRQTGEKKVAVEAGQTITITTDSKVEPSATVFPVNYPGAGAGQLC